MALLAIISIGLLTYFFLLVYKYSCTVEEISHFFQVEIHLFTWVNKMCVCART